MNEHKPFQEFIQELRRAEIELTDDTSSQNQSLLDFEYDIPLLFNGHILLSTYQQHLEGNYSAAVQNLKSSLSSFDNVALEKVLLEARLLADELKQEFKGNGNNLSLSRAKITMEDCGLLNNANLDDVKKKRCCLSISNTVSQRS